MESRQTCADEGLPFALAGLTARFLVLELPHLLGLQEKEGEEGR